MIETLIGIALPSLWRTKLNDIVTAFLEDTRAREAKLGIVKKDCKSRRLSSMEIRKARRA